MGIIMNLLSQRRVWWLGGVALVASGALVFACSNNPGTNDGGADTGAADSTVDQSSQKEAGVDAPIMTCEAGVTGACDIVLQNCGSGSECKPVNLEAGACNYALECVSNTTGSITEGYACTQSGASNPCVAGLECIENRCARHCCLGDDSICGPSQPEGFTGKCAVNVSLQNCTSTVYSVCTYAKPCEPFQLQACGPGLTCLVTDSNGTASCSDYASGTDAGKAEKAACQYANDCEDGLGCYGAPDGGASSCQWNCYVKGMGGPYDSQIAADAGAGKGGCPGVEKCMPINWGGSLPAWFGLCQ
jgi:hypothetical protein